MRTTINLPDALAEAAKQRAADEGRTFTSIVEQALRAVLDEKQSREPFTLVTFEGGGRLLVDLEDKDAVAELLDADGWR